MSTRPLECGLCGMDHPSSEACPPMNRMCTRCADCADLGWRAIQAAVRAKILDDKIDDDLNETLKTQAMDLVAHLMHLADERGWNFTEILDEADKNYQAETRGDDCDSKCPKHREAQ